MSCGDENEYAYTMVAGEIFEVEFLVSINDVPEDLTGYTAEIELRSRSTSGALIGQWDDNSPELTRDDALGSVKLTLTAEQTNQFIFASGFMDLLLLKDPAGRRSATLDITLDRGVTR